MGRIADALAVLRGKQVRRRRSGLSSPAGQGWYPWQGPVRESYSGAWQQGVEIRQDVVLAYNAVYACATLISSDVAKLPITLQRRASSGIWQAAAESPLAEVLRKPNSYMLAQDMLEYHVLSLMLRGNAYQLKARDARGVVRALHPLHPDRCRPMIAPDGSVWYQLSHDDLAGVPVSADYYPASEVIHDRIHTLFHPLVGVGPLFAAGLPAMTGSSIQNNAARFFSSDATPPGVLTAPGEIDDDTAAAIKARWRELFARRRMLPGETSDIAVLGEGLDYKQITMTAVDAQLIEQLKWSAREVCTAFHMPPWKIGIEPMPAGSNAELANLMYYTDTLQKIITRIESRYTTALELDRTMRVAIDEDELTRMDKRTRFEVYKAGTTGGVLSPDEARRRENLPPVPGGDTPYLQQQNFSLAALARRDQTAFEPEPAPEPVDIETELEGLVLGGGE